MNKERRTMKVSTHMAGLKKWVKSHPKKNLNGFFLLGERMLTHEEVLKVINYAVEKGYVWDKDIPPEEVNQLLNNGNVRL